MQPIPERGNDSTPKQSEDNQHACETSKDDLEEDSTGTGIKIQKQATSRRERIVDPLYFKSDTGPSPGLSLHGGNGSTVRGT